MTTPAPAEVAPGSDQCEIDRLEAALMALPADDRGALLKRATRRHGEDPAVAPKLTPEQIALVNERAAQVERGEGREDWLTYEEAMASLREITDRIRAGESVNDVRRSRGMEPLADPEAEVGLRGAGAEREVRRAA